MTPRRFRPLLAAAGLLSAFALGGSVAQAQNVVRPGASAPATATAAKPVSSVTSPHGATLREACASCHRADGWKPARIAPEFKHAAQTFMEGDAGAPVLSEDRGAWLGSDATWA